MYLRAPGMDSSVARRRETGSGGRSLGLMAERPLKGNMEERPDMGVDKWRPTLERRRVAYRMEWLLSQALNNRLNHEGAQALSLSLNRVHRTGPIIPFDTYCIYHHERSSLTSSSRSFEHTLASYLGRLTTALNGCCGNGILSSRGGADFASFIGRG